MVETTQNGLTERPPGTAVVDGARPEQQQGSDGVHSAGQGSLRGPGQADQDDAGNQRGGDRCGVEPATKLRLHRLHQVGPSLHQSGNRVRALTGTGAVRSAGLAGWSAFPLTGGGAHFRIRRRRGTRLPSSFGLSASLTTR